MIVSLFEDETFENFLPLTYTKPVFKLKSGIFSFLERIQKVFPDYPLLLVTRDYLVPTLKQRKTHPINNPEAIDDDLILVNSTLVVETQTRQLIQKKLGKKIGVASRVHGVVTEDVPSFSLWAKSLGAKPTELYLKSAIETQKRVFARRGIKQSREDVELLKRLFSLTAEERREAGVVKRRFEL